MSAVCYLVDQTLSFHAYLHTQMELLIIHLSDDIVVVSLILIVSTADETHNNRINDPVVPSSVG